MSLWLQSTLEALSFGDYRRVREKLLPVCPIPVPSCLVRELEFAEVHCANVTKERFFPIRFLWLLEANEQRMFGLRAAGRSRYHPQKLFDFWQRASTDAAFRKEQEGKGFEFDLDAQAMKFSVGWIYIGDRYVEDFLEIEAAIGVEMLFSGPEGGELKPAFREIKRQRARTSASH